MKYKIEIKTLEGGSSIAPVIEVSQSQLDVLLKFADVNKDKYLNDVYKLNECEFTVVSIEKPKKDWMNKEMRFMAHRITLDSMCGVAPKVEIIRF